MKEKNKRRDISLMLSVSHWRSQLHGCRFSVFASLFLAAGVCVLVFLQIRSLSNPQMLGSYFIGSSGIVIREAVRSETKRSIRITNRNQIEMILRAIQANPTKDRVCAEHLYAVIEHLRGNATIQFCPHAYEMAYRGRTETYRMTPELLIALQNAVKDQPKRWYFLDWFAPIQ